RRALRPPLRRARRHAHARGDQRARSRDARHRRPGRARRRGRGRIAVHRRAPAPRRRRWAAALLEWRTCGCGRPAHPRRRRRAGRAAARGRLMPSLWGWLKDAFGGRPLEIEPEAELPAEEAFLRNLLERVTEPSDDGKVTVGDREFWSAVQRLLSTGRERTAIDILSRFVAARPDDHAVGMRLAEILCDRLEHASAPPLPERLATVREHALRARFLLADAAERIGD